MKISIAAAQYPVTRHPSFSAWRDHTAQWVANAAGRKAGLLLFPEYGSMELVSTLPEKTRADLHSQITGINSLQPDFCEVFASLAKKHGLIIVAPSFPLADKGKHINRAYVFSPEGLAGYQDKFFMTRFENEEWGICTGEKILTVFESDWGSFGIQICYDVEFGLGAHLLSAAGATLILAPSCTETPRGAARVHIGARSRALENQVYTVVSQTVGTAPWSPAVDINYGYAAFYSTPDGSFPDNGILNAMAPQMTGWLVQELDPEKIESVRKTGEVLNFRDSEKVTMRLSGEEISVRRKQV